MNRLTLTLLAMVTITGCRPPAPALPTARPTVAGEGPLEPIPWSAVRRLTWSDFRAQPVVGTNAAALTSTNIAARFVCSGELFGFDVAAVFYPDRSWVNHEMFLQLGSDRWALRHEQTHFDITEVHARRMRQFFSTLAGACARSGRELEQMADRFLNDAMAAQSQYDRETLNGGDGRAQRQWDTDVQRMLTSLADFDGRR